MEKERLELEQVSGYFDDESGILFITYRGLVTGDVSAKVYAWLGRLIQQGHDPASARGSVYDFREVKDFVMGNLTTTHTRSQSLNTKVDITNHPVALIVGNMYQRMTIKTTMNITPQQRRKRIVESMEEALAFIEEWHRNAIHEPSHE
jgi:bifunctional ADP-heptose synthase (sugar kinase/adenylyltransferase)